MNVQDVVTRVRRTFGDEAAVQVSDEDVFRWINDAQVAIVKNNEQALPTTAFVNLVANQSTYTLPADYLMLQTLRWKFSSMTSYQRLRFKSMQQLDEEIDGWDGTNYPAGNPVFYTLSDNTAILFPTPDESMTSGLKVLYSRKPTDVDNLSDSLTLPLIYHDTVVKYCLWQASMLDDDNETALMHQANFTADKEELLNKEIKEPLSTYPVITTREFDL